jgi:hypothetical protein
MKRLYLAVLFLLGAVPASAAWHFNGNDVAHGYSYVPVAVPDLSGGAIVVWAGTPPNSSGPSILKAQRISADGDVLWSPGGVQVLSPREIGYNSYTAVPDGFGGVVIGWIEARQGFNTDPQVFVQRLDAAGLPLWTQDGVQVSTLPGTNSIPSLVPTPSGGVIVSFARSTSLQYSQLVNASGATVWSPGGVVLVGTSAGVGKPFSTSDGQGGALVFWPSVTGASRQVIGQRVSPDGTSLWGSNGVVAASGTLDYYVSDVTMDGSGGANLLWFKDWQVYVQRLSASGTVLWGSDGLRVSGTALSNNSQVFAADGSGGVTVAWNANYPTTTIHAQRVDASGNTILPLGGIIVSNPLQSAGSPSIAASNDGSALLTWMGSGEGSPIMANSISTTGLGSPNASFINTKLLSSKIGWLVVPTSDGAHIALWTSRHNEGSNEIQTAACQRIEEDGSWSQPLPSIQQAADIPGDEGGYLRLTVSRSANDDPMTSSAFPVTGYNVWRKIPATTSTSLAGDVVDVVSFAKSRTGARISGEAASLVGFPDGDWESVGFHAAKQSASYNFVAPTLKDSTPSSAYTETLIVTAHTTNPYCFYVSIAASGSSIDNLAPTMPAEFAATTGGNGAQLSWADNREADLVGYKLYAGSTSDFEPSPQTLISSPTSSHYIDVSWSPGQTKYYKLSAIDRHENESVFAFTSAPGPVAVLLKSLSVRAAFAAVHISWQLSGDAVDPSFLVYRVTPGDNEQELNDARVTKSAVGYAFEDDTVVPGGQYRYRVEIINNNDVSTLFATELILVPRPATALGQNHPNPFNPSTTIDYSVSQRSPVSIGIWNASGALVATLEQGTREAGVYHASWDGRDAQGRLVASGVYFYRLIGAGNIAARKMILVK